MSRLDYFLVSQDIFLRTNFINIKPKIFSDHSRVVLNLNFTPQPRGKSYWKFNNLFLNDKTFLDSMNKIILKQRYEVKDSAHIDLDKQWEDLKLRMSNFAKEYAKDKAKQKSNLIEKFEQRLSLLDKRLIETQNPQTQQILRDDIRKTENVLLDEFEVKVEGAKFRSKAQYYLYGEKNSSYFFNLEKSRANAKILSRIIRQDGSVINDPKAILKEEAIFYAKLNGGGPPIKWPYVNRSQIKLSEKDKGDLDKEFSDQELANSLCGMANSKTPGVDGFSADFYKVFWIHLGPLYGRVVRYLMIKGKLHESARKGLITLLPKKNKDLDYLYNWRPLTLLNVDYKIISHAIALRLKTRVDELIHPNQTGFLQGRNIAHSLRTVLDVVQIAKEKSLEMIIVSMDWEKCFDLLSFEAIDKALDYFNFGSEFRRYVQILLQDSESSVMNNGHFSPFFKVKSGAKQGSNASPFLFIYLAEILAIQIRDNKNIKGIKLGDIEHKLAQFADDMNMFLQFEKTTVIEVENVLIAFEEASNLKVNYNKTCLYKVGSLSNSNAHFITKKPFVWSDGPVRNLGIKVHNDSYIMQQINTEELLERVENICKAWHHRGLTLLGKTLVLNTLCASLYVYKLTVLGTLEDCCIKSFNKIMRQFLWQGGRPKIALHKLQTDKEHGGLKLVNLKHKDTSLKCQWVSVCKSNYNIRNLALQFLPPIGLEIFQCNLQERDIKKIMRPCFWRDVLTSWFSVYFVQPDNISKIAVQSLWYNSAIKVNGSVFYLAAYRAGIKFIYNIWNPIQLSFLSFEQMNEIYVHNNLTHLQYYGLLSAIPQVWIQKPKEVLYVLDDFIFPFENFEGSMSAQVYTKLISNKNNLLTLCTKWESKLQTSIVYESFLVNFENIFKLTTSTKFRSFQYRFLHRIVYTADNLYQWRVVDSPTCAFCEEELETVEHLFYFCKITYRFWEMFQAWFECLMDSEITLSVEEIFFCNSDDDLLNTLFLIAKQFIFSRKCFGRLPNIYIFRDNLMEIIHIERSYAFSNHRFKPFVKKWKRIFGLD